MTNDLIFIIILIFGFIGLIMIISDIATIKQCSRCRYTGHIDYMNKLDDKKFLFFNKYKHWNCK